MVMFTPFNKKISDLKKNDLKLLIEKNISEGWFIEYKEDFIDKNKISKSIASFANSDGGWFFIGIKDNEDNVAEELKGFDITTNKKPKERIRDIIKNISPIPFFESKLIKLEKNKYILVVLVHRGDEPPYIAQDGKIYVRTNEGSDPVSDRYIIEKLFERAKETKVRIEKFSTLSINNCEDISFLEFYMFPYPLDIYNFKNFFTKDFFYELKNNFNTIAKIGNEPTGNLNFNEIYSCYNSYILKSKLNSDNENIRSNIIIELFNNGNVKIYVPILNISNNNNVISPKIYNNSSHFNDFFNFLIENNLSNFKIIDSYSLFLSLTIIFNQYLSFLKNNKYSKLIYFRMRFNNIKNHILFFDDDNYLKFIKENGIPIIENEKIEIPDFYNGYSFQIDLDNNDTDFPIMIARNMFEALGLPFPFIGESFLNIGDYLSRLREDMKSK